MLSGASVLVVPWQCASTPPPANEFLRPPGKAISRYSWPIESITIRQGRPWLGSQDGGGGAVARRGGGGRGLWQRDHGGGGFFGWGGGTPPPLPCGCFATTLRN